MKNSNYQLVAGIGVVDIDRFDGRQFKVSPKRIVEGRVDNSGKEIRTYPNIYDAEHPYAHSIPHEECVVTLDVLENGGDYLGDWEFTFDPITGAANSAQLRSETPSREQVLPDGTRMLTCCLDVKLSSPQDSVSGWLQARDKKDAQANPIRAFVQLFQMRYGKDGLE